MPTANDPRKIIAYARFSSQHQSRLSTEAQLATIREHAARLGWVVDEVITDEEISGALVRPGWTRLTAMLHAGELAAIMVDELSRVSRGETVSHLTFDWCEHHGTALYECKSSTDYGRPENRGYGSFNALQSAEYRRTIQRTTTHRMNWRHGAGLHTGGHHFGYKSVEVMGSDGKPAKKLVIDPEEAAIVRHVFSLRGQGWGWARIAKHLNDPVRSDAALAAYAGGVVPYPSAGHRTRDAGGWTKTGVALIVQNPKYKGVWVYGRRNAKVHPERRTRTMVRSKDEARSVTLPDTAIVDALMWQRAQGESSGVVGIGGAPRRAPGKGEHRHLLSGLLECPRCGSTMVIFGGGNKRADGSHIRYYRCARHHREKLCDFAASLNAEKTEAAVLDGLFRQFESVEFFDVIRAALDGQDDSASERAVRVARERSEIEAGLRRLSTRLADAANPHVERAILDEMQRMSERIEALRVEGEALVTPAPVLPTLSDDEVRELLAEVPGLLRGGAGAGRAREVLSSILARPLQVRGDAWVDDVGVPRHGWVVTADLVCTDVVRALVPGPWQDGASSMKKHKPGVTRPVQDLASPQPLAVGDPLMTANNASTLVAGAGFEPATFGL